MYLFYLDESGTPENGASSKTFVLSAIGIPAESWTRFDAKIAALKRKFQMDETDEIHVAWLLRRYAEQERIENFEALDKDGRIAAVKQKRAEYIVEKEKLKDVQTIKDAKKNFKKTETYLHLSFEQRKAFVSDFADLVGSWGKARIFAEIIDKEGYVPPAPALDPVSQAFEQVVVRIENFLRNMSAGPRKKRGLLIYDNNPSVSEKLTKTMKRFLRRGTFFSGVEHIIETPLFVSSELSSMVQVADLCAFAVRRYVEFGENDLMNKIKERFDRNPNQRKIIGVRHYTARTDCKCIFWHASAKKSSKKPHA